VILLVLPNKSLALRPISAKHTDEILALWRKEEMVKKRNFMDFLKKVLGGRQQGRLPDSIYAGIDVRKVLILHFNPLMGIGDQIMPMRLPNLIEEKFPGAEIYIAAKYPFIYSGRNVLDLTQFVPEGSFLNPLDPQAPYVQNLASCINANDFDVLYDIDGHKALHELINAPLIIDGVRFRRDNKWDSIPFNVDLSDIELTSNWYDIVKLGLRIYGLDTKRGYLPRWEVSIKAESKARSVLSKNDIFMDRPIIFINSNSARAGRELDTSDWIDFLEFLQQKEFPFKDYYFVITQGINGRHYTSTKAIADKLKLIYDAIGQRCAYEPLLPRVTFEELAGIISLCSRVITVDSSIGHLAPALQIPALVIFPAWTLSQDYISPLAIGMDIDEKIPGRPLFMIKRFLEFISSQTDEIVKKHTIDITFAQAA